ncbi:uncharacterized protein LOC105254860 [Camponotus floridanus]|uniref:uncharacterized protein LOC105254860 n=1 Tax=Camponotus floridanus TaxID=104421 RepID=UPI00059D942D|nr:uncharacterized protein LOC105254860 [Camponotus floridanus]
MDGTGNTDDTIKEASQCFVCDAEIQGRFYALATCRTQHSNSRVIEKLGELVGERYMVVISEDDVICRSCAIRINHLDRLEMEMRNIRDHVLRFLEKKYSLEDGELRGGGDKPKSCQPPQITKSSTKDMVNYCSKQNKVDLETEERKNSIYSEDTMIQKNSHSWLQCDKCKYTTHLNSFIMSHLRDHTKQREFCDKCGLYISENQRENIRHSCTKTNKSGNKENEKDNSDKNNSMKTFLLENTLPTLPLIQTTQPPLIDLSSSDPLYISSILPGNNSSEQSMSISQSVNIDISRNMKRSLESNPVQEIEMKSKKQVLTLTDDGSMELSYGSIMLEGDIN